MVEVHQFRTLLCANVIFRMHWMVLLHGCQLPVSLLNLIFESCLCLLFFSSYMKSETVSHVRVFATPWSVCSPPGSSVHGILLERILEWFAIPFSKKFSWPKEQTWISCTADRFFTVWATRETCALLIWNIIKCANNYFSRASKKNDHIVVDIKTCGAWPGNQVTEWSTFVPCLCVCWAHCVCGLTGPRPSLVKWSSWGQCSLRSFCFQLSI